MHEEAKPSQAERARAGGSGVPWRGGGGGEKGLPARPRSQLPYLAPCSLSLSLLCCIVNREAEEAVEPTKTVAGGPPPPLASAAAALPEIKMKATP